MTRDEVLQGIREIVATMFLFEEVEEYDDDTPLARLGLDDEYDFAPFVTNLESWFDLEHIPDEATDSWRTVRDIVDYIVELQP